MSIRRVRWAMVIGALLLSGCTLQSQRQEDSRLDAMVTTPQLDSRLGKMEERLAQYCTTNADLFQTHQRRLLEVDADVHEVNGLVRALRADVEKLGSEPGPVLPDCPGGDIEALDNKTLLGRNEWVGLPNVGTYLKARIDSGANTASISARDITEFEREGEDWVRFKLALNDEAVVVDAARDKWIEAEVTRRVRILQASGEESRPVINLLLELGPIKQNVDFTLNDRSHLTYPVLLGRRFMMDIALIDVAQAYIHERPEYPGGEPAEMAAEDEASDRIDDDENE